MTLKIIFLRHGETVENKAGIIQGHMQGRLNELGIKQAQDLAQRLKDVDITHIYSSDLGRAADTAKEIAKYHPNAGISYMKELRERDYGSWAGKTVKETGWDLDRQWDLGLRFGGGETIEEVAARLSAAISRIKAENKYGTVVVVGHRISGQVLVAILRGMAPEKAGGLSDISNADLIEVEV